LVRAQGIDVLAVRPPSVPEGTARIRLTVTAAHEDRDIQRAITVIKSVLAELKGRNGDLEWPRDS